MKIRKMTLNEFISALYAKFMRIRTQLLYGWRFGHIGRRTVIYQPLRLVNSQNVFLGDSVSLYKQARIETILKWGNEQYQPKIIIGNGVSFQQRLHLTCARHVEIKDDAVILADVCITDINHSYKDIMKNVLSQPLEVKATIIGRCCFIGMGAKIMAGTQLGDNCIVGSNSVVSGVFPPFTVLVGTPAKMIKRYDFATHTWKRTDDKGAFIDEH